MNHDRQCEEAVPCGIGAASLMIYRDSQACCTMLSAYTLPTAAARMEQENFPCILCAELNQLRQEALADLRSWQGAAVLFSKPLIAMGGNIVIHGVPNRPWDEQEDGAQLPEALQALADS